MSWNTTWHADAGLLSDYVDGSLGRVATASVEAHLMTCPSCRATIASMAPPERLARNLAAIEEVIDQPPLHRLEKILEKLGVPDRISRVLVVTPATLGPWLVAVLLAVTLALVADLAGESDRTLFAFLVLAPLLPMAAVTVTFASRGDPARELIVATPTAGFDLLLLRSLAVLVPAVVLLAVASLLIPQQGMETVLWLLPSLGLTAATLALGTWFPVRLVAWALGGVWVTAALISVRDASSTDMVDHFAAFRPAGQLALVAVGLLAAVVVTLRRDTFDVADIGRIS